MKLAEIFSGEGHRWLSGRLLGYHAEGPGLIPSHWLQDMLLVPSPERIGRLRQQKHPA